MDTVLILSTSKVATILLTVLLLSVGCADKKIRSIVDVGGPREQSIPYDINPEKSSGEYAQTFIDKTQEYGLKDVQGVHLYAVDVNNDGATDLVVLDDFLSSPKFYFFNIKEKKFELGPSAFNEIVRASYLNFIDLDHDGVLDVIVGNLNQKSELTQYSPRVFKGVIVDGKLSYVFQSTLPIGILPTASIVPLDFNLDGEIDLFIANWFSQNDANPKPLPDSLLQGNAFSFINISTQLQGEYEMNGIDKSFHNATPTFGATICDVDKNGLPDILTNNSNGYHNKLWLNMDGVNFTNYGTLTGYSADNEGSPESRGGGNSFFSLCGDYNNDGIVDIVVGNLARDTDTESRDKSAVLTGSTKSFPPKFYRTEILPTYKTDNWVEGNRRGIWLDYNLDGLNDLMIANSGFPPTTRLMFYEQQPDHEYIDRALEMGINLMNPSGMVSIDLNGDGVMDFISGQSRVRAGDIKNRIYVFENQTKRQGRGSIRFHLQGKKSNYHGISSTLNFKTNKTTRRGEANPLYGSLPSQNEEGVYFAFGNESPQSVEVRWSAGLTDKIGRITPIYKKYNLLKISSKGKHTELNLCEDGRVLARSKKCY